MDTNQKQGFLKKEKSKEQKLITGLLAALILTIVLVVGLIVVIVYWGMTETVLVGNDASNAKVSDQTQESDGDDGQMENLTEKDGFLLEVDQRGDYRFINEREGYELTIPGEMTMEISLNELCSSFGNEKMSVEIYMQRCESAEDMESYIHYSDTFLENGEDHTPVLKEIIEVAGYAAHLTQWSRPSLKDIEGDKPHYICLDIMPGGNQVCTLLFKSTASFKDEFLSIAETIRFSNESEATSGSAISVF